jgi:hypothetical protein
MQAERRIVLEAKFSNLLLQQNIEYVIKMQVRPTPS